MHACVMSTRVSFMAFGRAPFERFTTPAGRGTGGVEGKGEEEWRMGGGEEKSPGLLSTRQSYDVCVCVVARDT